MRLEAAAAIGTPEQVRLMLGPVVGDWPANARFAAVSRQSTLEGMAGLKEPRNSDERNVIGDRALVLGQIS